MKNSSYFLLICVLAVSMFTKSCGDDFLSRPAQGSLSEDVVADVDGVNTLLMGAYAALNQSGDGGWADGIGPAGNVWPVCPSNWIYGSLMGMEAHKGSDAGDQPQMNTLGGQNHSASTGFLNFKWIGMYEGIARANAVLSVLPDVETVEGVFTENDKTQVEAEARFIRGHFYFDLTRFFGNVPWVDEETDAIAPQANDEDTWQYVEADFQFAYDNLPGTQDQVGRPNNWAAASYLAKTYMYQEKFSEAKALYDEIIPNGQTSNGLAYDLVPLNEVHDPMYKNHAETVFAIQASSDDGTGTINNANAGMMLNYPYNSPFRCCGFFQPTRYLVNAYQTDGDGLPMVDDHLSSEVKWDQGIDSDEHFEPHEGPLDPRLDWTVGRRGVPFFDWGPHPGNRWIRDQSYSGPFAARKHLWWRRDDTDVQNPQSWAPGSSYNIPIIRFADVLLMAAEAEIELGNMGTALDYINRVRARAADDTGEAWHNNDFNRGYAFAEVDSEAEMLNLDDRPNAGDWVVRNDTETTFTYLGGGPDDINNWNEYPDPSDNYDIDTYDDLGSQAEARDIVRFERLLELSLEGHRYFDLIRWGIAENELNSAMDYEGAFFPASYINEGRFSSGKNELFPIPQRQIDLSVQEGEASLEQNPGY